MYNANFNENKRAKLGTYKVAMVLQRYTMYDRY